MWKKIGLGFVVLFILSISTFQACMTRKTYKLTKKFYKSPKSLFLDKAFDPLLDKAFDPHDDFANNSKNCVLSVKTVKLDRKNAYNGSIVRKDDQSYYLFFRKDTFLPKKEYITSICLAVLDKEFNQVGESLNLTPLQSTPEDPRAFVSQGEIYVIYNDLITKNKRDRGLFLTHFDKNTNQLEKPINLLYSCQGVEKNWTPIENGLSEENFQFVYNIYPHSVQTIDFQTEELHLQRPLRNEFLIFAKAWNSNFGTPRGGAPIIAVEDYYLNFFHSTYRDNRGILWYSMGAYIFEKQPPYKIIAFTPVPISFEGLYDTPVTNDNGKYKKVIYPAGVVRDRMNDRPVLHVSCGENDSAVKIVTIDEQKLINSMKFIQ